MHALLLTVLLLGTLGFTPAPQPPTDIQVVDAAVTYRFGEEILFEATIRSSQPVQEVALFFQAEGGQVVTQPTEMLPDGKVSLRYTIPSQKIRPFSRVYYWFRITTGPGQETTSPSFWFDYDDNRFTWQTLEDSVFHVHWYHGDVAFGQSVQNTALAGLDAVQKLVPLAPPTPLNVYVYANSDDLCSALQLGGSECVAGHANPDLGMVMVSGESDPESTIDLERQLPHELSHVLLYHATGNGYANLPAWLVEGIASLSELYPNPDYQRVLDQRKTTDSLLGIESLCGAFPGDTASAYLAYAESASFTRFIYTNYGVTGLQNMIQQYQGGLGCTQGVSAALNTNLAALETRWRQDALGIQVQSIAWQTLLPYILIFGAVVIVPLIATVAIVRKKQVPRDRENQNGRS